MGDYIYFNYPSASDINGYGGTETIANSFGDSIEEIYQIGYLSIFEIFRKIKRDHVHKKILFTYLPPIMYLLVIAYCIVTVTQLHKLSFGLPKRLSRKRLFLVFVESKLNSLIKILTVNLEEYKFLKIKGVNAEYIFPESKYQNTINVKKTGQAKRVCFVGRWDLNKGTEEFKSLVLRRNNLSVEFIAITYKISSIEIRRLNDLGVKVYDFSGDKRDDDLFLNVLSSCDCAIFPYKSLEGTTNPPLLPIEALSLGITCILRPLGDLRILMENYPFLLDTDGDEELSNVFENYIKEPLVDKNSNLEFYDHMLKKFKVP